MPYCGICDLGFISDVALEGHRTDKKHLSRSEEYQRRVLEAAHNVHVTGFSRNISHEDLNAYFSNFGKVLDVTYIDHNSRWPFAFVKFENLLVASQVLRYKHHCLNGHFLRVQPKRLKFRNPNRLEVSNLCSANMDIPNQIGCQQQSGYQGKSHKKFKDVNFLAQDFNEIFSNLIKKLSKINTIAEQMITLYEELKLSDDDLTHRMEFCDLLYTILEPYFPGCSVVLFGSSVNGFGVKGCDIDIFLDISHLMPSELPPTDASNSALKKLIQKDALPVQMKEFLQLTPYQRIKYILKIIARKLHTNYCNFFPVPSMRCPIVRFSHKISEITCDFSIQNKMGLCNSYLMKFLSQYDSRIQPFVFAIRMWAKNKKIASVGGTRFSSYSLTLMILFFLQNLEPAVLPSIQEVMDACTKEEEIMIDGFSCSYPQRPAHNVLPLNKNKDLLGDLLKKFFDFFLHLDYETTVISPRTGNLLSRSEIESQEELKSFRMSPVCVQDPYLLEHNTSANVTDKIKTDFIKELSVAQNKLSQMQVDGNPWGLVHLITEDLPNVQSKHCRLKFKPQHLPYSLNLPVNVGYLNRELDKSVRKFHNTRILWCKILCSFLQVVLKEVLLIECCIEKEHLSLKELLKATETPVQDGSGDCKTTFSLSSDMAVEAMENEEATSVITNENNVISSDSSKNPAQIFQKRQSDEYIREVKRICLKDQEISEVTGIDFNCEEYSDMVPQNFENIEVSKPMVTNCHQCGPNKNTVSDDTNSRKEIIEAIMTSKSTILQEIASAPFEVENICEDEDQHPDPNSLLQMICTVRHYSWRNRKKVRQKLLPHWNGSDFEMEKKISEYIVSANESIILKPSLTTFRFTVTPEINTSVCVHINPIKSACKEVSVFYQFLSSFITRMVSSHFVKWCIHTSPQKLDSSELCLNNNVSTYKPNENSDDGLVSSTN